MFLNPNIFFSNLNSNCSNLSDMRNLKNCANSQPSVLNFKSFYQSLEHFFSQVRTILVTKYHFFPFLFFAVVVLESLLTLQIRLVLFMLKFVNQGLCKMRTFSLKFPWDCVNSRWSWSKETSLEIHGGWMRYQSSSDFVTSSL